MDTQATDIDLLGPLRETARADPDRIALKARDRGAATYAQMLASVDACVAALRAEGVASHSRVATILPNAPETAVAILAIASFATVVPLNPAYPPDEMRSLLARARVSHILSDAETIARTGQTEADPAIGIVAMAPDRTEPAGTFGLRWLRPGVGANASDAGPPRTALLLHTSGSTGTPKRVPLTRENLSAAARNVARSLRLSPADTCLNMMPMFHIGAVADLLLAPLYAGGAVAFAPDISAPAFFGALEAFEPTWFQAVPTVLRDILAHEATAPDVERIKKLRFIRAVSQPLPDKLEEDFTRKFGVALVPIFGMTETAGLIASMPLDAPREKRGSVGIPFGPQVKIGDAHGNEVAAGGRGEVLVSGPTVMRGYEDAQASRDETFRGSWLRSGDEGYLDRDGFLYLTGRIKETINRGGEKISPSEIDRILADHPGIREAAAFAVPHPTLGEEPAVAVVARDGNLDASAVIGHLRGKLAEFKIPRSVIFVDRLPRLPSGKLDRLALPALVTGANSPAARTPPASAEEKTLAELWRRILRVGGLALEDDFFDLGGDSLSATNLAVLIEGRFGREIEIAHLFDTPTLGAMAAALGRELARIQPHRQLDPKIAAAVKAATVGWRGKRLDGSLIVSRNTLGTMRPFFWVCQSNWQFEALSERLNPDRPFHVLRSLSATPVKSDANTAALARHYASEIVALQPEGPYLVGGFCQGGVVAFRIAKTLEAMGHSVSLLAIQDRFIAEPYDGPMALFSGKRGWFCAWDLNDNPERAWAKYYSGPLSVFHSAGDHDDLHKPPYVDQFARQLEGEFERVEAGLPLAFKRSIAPMPPLDTRSLRASIRADIPRFLRQGSTRVIDVRVRNTSPVPWEATPESGIILAARWRVLDRLHGYQLDGRTTLSRPIAPGETASFAVPIRVPMRGLPMFLDIDLVEDGNYWFGGIGRSGMRKLVIPLPPE